LRPRAERTAASVLAWAGGPAVIGRGLGGCRGIDLQGPPGLVANRLADRYLRNDPGLRQRVLETSDVIERGELVLQKVANLLVTIRRAKGGLFS